MFFFLKQLGNLVQIFAAYYTLLSTLDYAILSATTQLAFRPMVDMFQHVNWVVVINIA